jgi:hypothetical protein
LAIIAGMFTNPLFSDAKPLASDHLLFIDSRIWRIHL